MQSFVRVRPEAGSSSGEAADAPTVLFVTDDRDLREVAERALGRVGFEVIPAGHAGHAILACLGGCRVDVLITELAMRDTTGPALAEQLRRYQPGLPVIFLAPAGTPESDGIVVRPFTRDDLARELQRSLAQAPGR